MRVLAVGNAYPPHHLGGYEIIWHGVTRELRRRGHETRVLTTIHRTDGVTTADDSDVHRELDWYWRDHEWRELGPLARTALEWRNARTFDRHVREFSPDVIAWWAVGGLSLGLIERARVPAVFFVLDYWPRYALEHDLWMRAWRSRPRTGALAQRLTGLPTRAPLGQSGRWLFCSQAAREELSEFDVRDWAILSPGVEQSYLELPPEAEPPEWRWRLLYVGRVVEQKGVRTAIEALAHLPAEATLRIVGDGDLRYRAELQQLTRELGLLERVRFEPARPRAELPGVYREADAVVFPVFWPEPWGLVPLEAMAAGRPVLATGRGGCGDFLRDGENSLLFEAGDAYALAGALRRLCAERGLRERLCRRGREAAWANRDEVFVARAVDELKAAAGAVELGAVGTGADRVAEGIW